MFVYIGTYSSGGGKGIYVYRMDESGKLAFTGQVAEAQNPSYLAFSLSGRFLYATHEIWDEEEKPGAGLSAFAIDMETGGLAVLNRQQSGATGPCYVAVSPDGKTAATANYGGGSVSSFPLNDDGTLGERASLHRHEGSSTHAERQDKAYAHSVVFDASGRFAFCADLGVDKIFAYRVDSATGKLAPHDAAFAPIHAGAGPRHLVFDKANTFAYVINELDSTISTLRYDAKNGALQEIESVSTLPKDFRGESTCAEILLSPSGKFLYGSNRGHDSIAIFAADESSGHLAPLGHQPTGGKTPRNFGLDPTGRFLVAANQDSNNLVVFRIDENTGLLTPTGQILEVPAPVCVKFLAPPTAG